MANIEIDGATFRVEVEGDATRPALLLVNSLGTDLCLWDVQMPALLEHFRVVRYDARGHGASSVPREPLSIGRLGRDALAIVDALHIERFHVVGISMGGAVAQWLLVHAPHRVERGVLCCTAARLSNAEVWNGRILAVRRDGMSALADATIERWFGPAFRTAAADQVAAVHEMLLATSSEGYAACCGALRDMDLRQALHAVEAPVLVLTGSDDPAISADDTAVLLASLANARHVEVGARHIANIEAAVAFTAAVVQFLMAKLPARRKPAHPAGRTKASRHATAARQPIARRGRPRKAGAVAAAARKAAGARKPTRSRPPVRAARVTAAPAPAKAKRAPSATLVKPTTPQKKATPKPKDAKAATRRATKTSAARGAVKKPATKAKPSKTTPRKAVAKPPAKAPSAKRPSAPRRKPAKTPRRPSGRRKT